MPPIRARRNVDKSSFSTREAAELCELSIQTIIRYFDSGLIKGFRVPGSRARRIPREELRRFMQSNGMPTAALDGPNGRVLVIDHAPAAETLARALRRDGRFEVRTAATGFEAGFLTRDFDPRLIVLNPELVDSRLVSAHVRDGSGPGRARLIALAGRTRTGSATLQGADVVLEGSVQPARLIERLAGLLRL